MKHLFKPLSRFFLLACLLLGGISQVWGADLVVTYDFSSRNNLPTGFPTSSGTSATAEKNITMTNGASFGIVAKDAYYSTADGVKGSGKYVLFFGKNVNTAASSTDNVSSAYIKIPAKVGYKISKVVMSLPAGNAKDVKVNIFSQDYTAMSTEQTTVNGTAKTFTFTLSNSTENTAYYYTVSKGVAAGKNLQLYSMTVTYTPTETPSLSTSVTTLTTPFSYTVDEGPSSAQSFTVSGANLSTNATVSAPTNFEVCATERGSYTSTITLSQSSGIISSAKVYVRLKSGLAVGNSYSGNVSVSSTGATTKNVAVSGNVTPVVASHNIIIDECTYGVVSTDPEHSAQEGATVTINVTPNPGYELGELKVNNGDVAVSDDYKFTMPTSDVTISATFVKRNYGIEAYRLNFVQCGTDASGKDTTGTDRGTVYAKVPSAVFAFNSNKISAVDVTRVYAGRQPMGAKFGGSSNKGTLVITLANATNIQSIVFNAAMYGATSSETNADKGFTVKLNDEETGTSMGLSAGNKVLEDKVLYVGGKSVTKITIEQNEASKGRFYMHHIAIYTAQASVAISAAEYSTYHNASSAYVMPAGLVGITVEEVNGSTLTLNTSYSAGDIVPVGEALILHGDEGTYSLVASTTGDEKSSTNMLKGTSNFDELTTGGNKYYRLSQHNGSVGFYWGAAEGAAFQLGANKAYLALSGTNAPDRFVFNPSTPIVTGVDETLNKYVKSGKTLVNGKLYIIPDGKVFDLNGRLVK